MMRPLLLALFVLAMSACRLAEPADPTPPWEVAHWRAIDPDDARHPGHDLIALYTRNLGSNLEIRLDLLDMGRTPDFDLFLALDSGPAGTDRLPIAGTAGLRWDTLLVIPGEEAPYALDANLRPRPDLIPRVVRDPELDNVVVQVNRAALPGNSGAFRWQIFLTPTGEQEIADELGPISGDTTPISRAPVLLAYWDTFPAVTPAQALRRWDGAHTGPFGERHGLRLLIEAARRFKIPVTLLDLKRPAALSALDYLNVMPAIQDGARSGFLILPEVVPLPHQAHRGQIPFLPPEAILSLGVTRGRAAGLDFGLSASPLLYAPLVPDPPPQGARVIFLPPDSGQDSLVEDLLDGEALSELPLIQLAHWESRLLVPLTSRDHELQATAEGPALALRRGLVRLALSPRAFGRRGGDVLLALGGPLPTTAWGDPQAVRATLGYIAAHPWIRAVGAVDLLTARPPHRGTLPVRPLPPQNVPFTSQGNPIPSQMTVHQIQAEILEGFAQAPPGPINDLAWEAYFALLASNPPESLELQLLRSNSLGQIGALLAGARWAAAPQAFSLCDQDLDYDGQPECQLASENLFAVLESDGARLTFGLARTGKGVRQWIGPDSQFTVGLSDPSQWAPERGPAGDPALIPGGFSDLPGTWRPYQAAILPQGVEFTSLDGQIRKTYQFTPDGLVVRYQVQGDGLDTVLVPLALAPEVRFTPGWAARYRAVIRERAFEWSIDGEFGIEGHATAPWALHPFNGSGEILAFPEDPNLDYPPGHWRPFPLATLVIQAQEEFEVALSIVSAP